MIYTVCDNVQLEEFECSERKKLNSMLFREPGGAGNGILMWFSDEALLDLFEKLENYCMKLKEVRDWRRKENKESP